MIGGLVVQVLIRPNGTYVEVLDRTDRQWRRCVCNLDIVIGDRLWWQSWEGFHSRENEFTDQPVGDCKPAAHPDTASPSR